MIDYLNSTGLAYLLGKIKLAFVKTTDTVEVSGVDVDSTPISNSSNLVTSGGVYNALGGKEDKVAIETPVDTTDPTDPITSLTCEVNKYYRVDVAVDTLAVTLPAVEDTTHVNSITIMLTAGTTPAITFTAQAIGGTTPDVYTKSDFEIEAGKTYEISALFNGSAWVLTSVEIDVTSNP